jgi:putative ABC transport system permease protein
MLIKDLIQETYSNIFVNKARSGLTILGIVIGIGSVIAMVSIGQGASGTIQSSIESLGSNLIMVMPGMQRSVGSQVRLAQGSAQSLTLDDAKAIASDVNNVKAIAPEVDGRYQVTAKGTNSNTQVVGVDASYLSVKNLEVQDGVFISDQNITNTSKVAVLGPTARDDLFGDGADAIGQTIRIKGIEFKIVGVTVAKGGSGFSNQDDRIYIPISTAQRYLSGNSYVSTINVQAVDQGSMTLVQEDITSLLLERHKISDSANADFSIMNQADIISSASSITETLTILLGSIAGISLIVGGIGIMNMMLTTVTERTREIGLRKAIGAKKRDISLQFLAEAVMLTFVGGVLGIILGLLASIIISKLGTTTQVSSFSIVLAVCVSAGIGIIFGYYPARRASGLNPIEALRYE